MLKTGMKAPVLLRAAASALRKQHSSSDARFISQTWQRLGRPRLALRRLSEPRYFRQQASQLKMATASLGEKKKLVFLGTPEVAAKSLALLLDAASKPEASFEVAGVVSQPASRRGRNRELLPSPVAALAAQRGIAGDRIVTPEVARDADFLMWLEDLGPDLCVTAAYGLILPKTFLAIPARGTLNIHPSLLPDYRGAAPVQRCLQEGREETGVSLAFTVYAMDAGPILAQKRVRLQGHEQAPHLLDSLFEAGTQLLLDYLPKVWDGSAAGLAVPQDEAKKTYAAKLTKEESKLDFGRAARDLHNQVRAFAGWPGSSHTFSLRSPTGETSTLELKILRTRVIPPEEGPSGSGVEALELEKGRLAVRCGDAALLELLEVQPASKKPMPASALLNGLGDRILVPETPSVSDPSDRC